LPVPWASTLHTQIEKAGSYFDLKATIFRQPGGPEVLSYEDVPDPSPRPGEVLVKVKACGVNRVDIWVRSGRYQSSLPHILGTDIAGEVAEVGAGIREEVSGQRVLVYPVLSDGSCQYCLQGMPNRCVSRGLVGVASNGGYADYAVVPADNLVDIGNLDFVTAATLPTNFGIVWNSLVSRAKVGPGDTVLVWGAAGGVGYAAVQVSKLLGAKVIAAVGSDEKMKFVLSQGADAAINYNTQDLLDQVRILTEGKGASLVLDHVGGETWPTSLDCLARGGRLVAVGLTSGAKSEVDVRRVYQDELSIIGAWTCRREDLAEVLRFVAGNKLRPSVFKELPLKDAQRAHEILESRWVQGKMVLVP